MIVKLVLAGLTAVNLTSVKNGWEYWPLSLAVAIGCFLLLMMQIHLETRRWPW